MQTRGSWLRITNVDGRFFQATLLHKHWRKEKQAAERLVQEAEKQKVNLVNKAGDNALKKLAAEKAGDAVVNEAKKQADRLIEEAEEKGNALIEKAKNGETDK